MESHQNKNQSYSVLTFYRYLDGPFIVLQVIGVATAIIGGSFFTGSIFILCKSITEFERLKPVGELRDDIEKISWVLLMDAGVLWISCWMFFVCFHLVGQKVSYEIRWRYMKSILTKDVFFLSTEWFEDRSLEELPTKVHTNLNEVENSSGKTIGFIIYSISAWISGVVYGLLFGAVFWCWILFSPVIVMMIGGLNMFAIK